MSDDDFADFDERFQDLKRRFDARRPVQPGDNRAEFEAQRQEAEAGFEAEAADSRSRFLAEGGQMDQDAHIHGQDHQKQLTTIAGEEQGLSRRQQKTRSQLGQFQRGAKDALATVQDTAPGQRLQSHWQSVRGKARQFRRGQEDHPALPEATSLNKDDD